MLFCGSFSRKAVRRLSPYFKKQTRELSLLQVGEEGFVYRNHCIHSYPVCCLLSVPPCCLCVTLDVPVPCETPQWAADMMRSAGYAKMKDGYTKLLALRLEKTIRPRLGLCLLPTDNELVSNMDYTWKHTQVKCWKVMVDYYHYLFVMSISLGAPENLQA